MPIRKLPKYLSCDEVYAFRSGDSKYVCVLLDFITGEPIDLISSRKKKDLMEYFMRIPYEERCQVVMINTDMYEVYRQVFKKVFKSYHHSVDRFHVSQELHRRLDSVRVQVMKKYAGSAPPGKRDKSDGYYLCKHFNWILAKRPDSTDKYGELLFDPDRKRVYNHHFRKDMNFYELREKLLSIDAGLAEAEGLKNKFVDFYENNTYDTAEEALNQLTKEFLESSVPEMNEFARTLLNWRIEIINSFMIVDYSYEVDTSTGQVAARPEHMHAGKIERTNGTIKLLKKGSMGYKNWNRFRNRCLYVLRNNATYQLNPIDTPKNELRYVRTNVRKLPKRNRKEETK
jgi:transposase